MIDNDAGPDELGGQTDTAATGISALVDKDLSNYRIQPFFEIQVTHDEIGTYKTAKLECFLSHELAAFRAKGEGWWGADGTVVQIYVLIAKGQAEQGIALSGVNAGKTLTLCNDAVEKVEAAKQILAKLTPEERAILGHPDPE